MFHYSVVLNAIQLYNKYKSYNKVALEMSKTKKISKKGGVNFVIFGCIYIYEWYLYFLIHHSLFV